MLINHEVDKFLLIYTITNRCIYK